MSSQTQFVLLKLAIKCPLQHRTSTLFAQPSSQHELKLHSEHDRYLVYGVFITLVQVPRPARAPTSYCIVVTCAEYPDPDRLSLSHLHAAFSISADSPFLRVQLSPTHRNPQRVEHQFSELQPSYGSSDLHCTQHNPYPPI